MSRTHAIFDSVCKFVSSMPLTPDYLCPQWVVTNIVHPQISPNLLIVKVKWWAPIILVFQPGTKLLLYQPSK